MPADGWYQVAPLGEFAHAAAGVVQVVDADACAAMVNRFAEDAAAVNFAGLLVDFDHFSLDGEKRSEAAGWICAVPRQRRGRAGFTHAFSGPGRAAVAIHKGQANANAEQSTSNVQL
jgi:phage I-like protein